MIKIGIIGAGFIGLIHAEAYLKIKGAEIVAVSDKDNNKLRKFAEKYSVKRTFNDLSILDEQEIDVIDICLPTPLHLPVALQAIRRGKNVIIEKPIALTTKEGIKILKEAQKTKKIIMVAHVLRFWEEYVIIKNIVKEGIIGEIREIFMYRINELPLWSQGNWLLDIKKSGGIIIDLMIHDIDFTYWILGMPDKISVSGLRNDNDFPVEALITLHYKNNVKVYIEGGYLHPPNGGLRSGVRVYGSKGSIYSDSSKNKVEIITKDGKEYIPLKNKDGYKEELEYFINCVKKNRQPDIITLEDAIKSLEIAIKAKKIFDRAVKKWK